MVDSHKASGGLPPEIVADLVGANHILYDQGVLDVWGHVSVRDPNNPNRFWLSRSLPPVDVKPSDIMEFDIDSEPLNQNGRKIYIERFIHGEIYRKRPDVMSVLHHHAPASLTFSVSDVPLRALITSAGFLGQGLPVFEIRDVDDGPVIIIVNREQGRALAEKLGEQGGCLLARHGTVVVGDSIRQLVWRGIYGERNARIQLDALRLGGIRYLSDAEAAYSANYGPPDKERAWNYWLTRAKARAGDHDEHNAHL